MSTKPEALPIVAHLYKSEDGSGFARVHLSYLDARADALAGGSITDLTDHAQATAQLSALQDEVERLQKKLDDRSETLVNVGKFLNIDEAEERARPGYDGNAPASLMLIAAIQRYAIDQARQAQKGMT